MDVSFCVPVFNAEQHLETTVRALLSQSNAGLEVVAVDDGSTDGSWELMSEMAKVDRRLRCYRQANAGAAAARNHALSKANGHWIWFFDADDYLWPGSVHAVAAVARARPGHVIATTWLKFRDSPPAVPRPWAESVQQSGPGVEWILQRWLYTTSCTYTGSFCIPAQLAKSTKWNESLSVLDDLPYFTTAITRSPGVVQVQGAVFGYREPGTGNLSNRGGRRHAESSLRATEEAVAALLAAENSPRTRRAAANQLMLIAYATYVQERDIAEAASRRAGALARADIRFPGGPGRRLLMTVLGWRRGLSLHQRLRRWGNLTSS